MEGQWSLCGGGQFKGTRMIMLQRLSIFWRVNGHVTEVASKELRGWSCYRGC